MEILCIVQNPADQKNVSIQVQDICKITEPRENKNPETHYIEVITRQPEGNERVQMENEEYIGMPSPQRTKSETVYSTVQLPQPKYKR